MWEGKLRQHMSANDAVTVTSDHVAWLMANCDGDYTNAAQAVQIVQSDPLPEGEAV